MSENLIGDVAGLSKPLTKLIEVVSKALGQWASPYLQRKAAEASAYELNLMTEAMQRAGIVPDQIEYEGGKIKLSAGRSGQGNGVEAAVLGAEELSQRATQRANYQLLVQQQNIEAICALAAEQLSAESNVPDSMPDPDWSARFFEYSANVSDEEFRKLWGQILAGEVCSPGSFSLRALDVLRSLSRFEAETFKDFGRFMLQDVEGSVCAIIPDGLSSDSFAGATMRDLLTLSGAGLTREQRYQVNYQSIGSQSPVKLYYGPLVLLIEIGYPIQMVSVPIVGLTPAGSELARLLTIDPDMEYIKIIGTIISNQGGRLAWAKLRPKHENQEDFGEKTYVD